MGPIPPPALPRSDDGHGHLLEVGHLVLPSSRSRQGEPLRSRRGRTTVATGEFLQRHVDADAVTSGGRQHHRRRGGVLHRNTLIPAPRRPDPAAPALALALAPETTRGPGRVLLTITMDERWLRLAVGHGTLDFSTLVDPATVRRWACDATGSTPSDNPDPADDPPPSS